MTSLASLPSQYSELDEEQEVKACGRNDTGQLGVGNNLEHNSLSTVKFSALNRHRVLLLAPGTHHTLALTSNPHTPLFGWGWGKYGQLGTSSTASCYAPTPIPVTALLEGSSIVDISAGYSHSALVTSTGKLFTTGRNDMGQLGLGHAYDKLEFTHVKSISNVVKVSVGEYFCMALERSESSTEDKLWSFGSNEFGQLGIGDSGDRSRPQIVKLSDLASKVRVHLLRTGPFHCVVTLTNNRIYSWGRGDCGQTGLGHRRNTNLPQPMAHLMEIVGDQPLRLLAVRAHNIAVTSHSGQIVVWGRNNHAQLGLCHLTHSAPDGTALIEGNGLPASDFDDHYEPQLNTALALNGVNGAQISDVAVGPFHSSVIMDDGRMLVWGAVNNNGMPRTHRLDADDDTSSLNHVPVTTSAVQGRLVTHVAVGYSHVVFVLDPPTKINPPMLSMEFGACLDDATYSDISLLIQDRVIHAHRVVLATRSKFFRAMFASGMIEATQKEVVIRDSYEAFYALLLFLYTDSFYRGRADHHTAQLALDVLPLAELYDLPRLLQLCEITIIESQTIQTDNVVDLYELACRLRAHNLRNRCSWYITKHFESVSQTDAWIHKLPQELKNSFSPIAALHASALSIHSHLQSP